MADVIHFFSRPEEGPDLDRMDRAALEAYLAEVESRIAALDEAEPSDMDSEAYDVWGDRHEALEDLADDIRDRMEEA